MNEKADGNSLQLRKISKPLNMNQATSTLIVGAGPFALALASYWQHRGQDYRIREVGGLLATANAKRVSIEVGYNSLVFVIESTDIADLKALILSLQADIQRLRAENEELKARLAQNSTNSHLPPASDGLAKKDIKPAFPKVSAYRL